MLCDMKTSIFTHAVPQMSRFGLYVDVQQIQHCLSNMLPSPLCVLGAFVEDELTGNIWIYF